MSLKRAIKLVDVPEHFLIKYSCSEKNDSDEKSKTRKCKKLVYWLARCYCTCWRHRLTLIFIAPKTHTPTLSDIVKGRSDQSLDGLETESVSALPIIFLWLFIQNPWLCAPFNLIFILNAETSWAGPRGFCEQPCVNLHIFFFIQGFSCNAHVIPFTELKLLSPSLNDVAKNDPSCN